jgi:protein-L-isoaspartate(D-aspartate) O-methyltransferase
MVSLPSLAGTTKPTKVSVPLPLSSGLNAVAHRQNMVHLCRAMGVSHQAVLTAMERVERHRFIDPGLASRAYDDTALPIGHEQTISKPSSVARMLEFLLNRRDQKKPNSLRALEIGTGSGYQAAVMAQLFAQVISIERIRALHELAKVNLRPLRVNNLRLVLGDGHLGLPSEAPFDAIILAAAGTEVPRPLIEQLAVNGLLIAPVGGGQQQLHLVERVHENRWQLTILDAARFVPLKEGVV